MNNKKRVFLSYSYQDKVKVDMIAKRLVDSEIDVYYDSNHTEKNFPDNIQTLKDKIETSEILLLVISNNFLKSEWTNFELSSFLKEAHKRKITVIPVIIERSAIPNDLLSYEVINLNSNFESGLEKIIQKLKVIPIISFEDFSPGKFKNLISDVLKEYRFDNIQRDSSDDFGIDIRANYQSKSPFGTIRKEFWIVEVKFYKQERFSVNTIQKLIAYKRQLIPADLKLLLVTNSILTSVAQEYLENCQKIENTQIEVIDGLQLKKLISNRKRLLDKYFRA